jgi:magnesium-protoporphyrin O-methyltransferase
VAVDLSATLTDLARERLDPSLRDRVTFLAGDMLDPALGSFDYVVAMDSLIHYRLADAIVALGRLASRTSTAMAITFVPRTPLLGAMITAGRLFPRGDRSPAVEPVTPRAHAEAVERALPFWTLGRRQRIRGGFYTSEAVELVRGDR